MKSWYMTLVALVAVVFIIKDAHSMPPHLQGPVFLQEPPPVLEFSNTTGAILSCSGHGSPPPEIRWLDETNKDVSHIPRLRELLSNGSVYFPPFPSEDYSLDIHAASYKCRLSNTAGTIISRACRIRGEIQQQYQIQVHNVFAIKGNVAVLKCNIPTFVKSVVNVANWLKDEPLLGKTAIHPGGRYLMTASGTLHIRDTNVEDSYARYYCQTVYRLSGDRRLSLPGQLIVTDPEGNSPPRIEQSTPTVHAKAGSPTDLVCAAQASPPPNYRWFKDVNGILQELRSGSVLVRPLQSILQFPRVQQEDSGKYVCVASNLLGEDRRELLLSVITPLSVYIRPQQQVVDAGSSATFNCSIEGGGDFGKTITWLKDGRPVLESPRVNVMFNGIVLMIRSVRRGDRGMYQCMARNDEDNAQGSAELTLGAVAPELQSTFIEQTLQPGPPVSLRCSASGNPPPRITWLLDGGELLPRGYVLGSYLDLAGDVVSHLNISSVRVQHGGLYTCLVRNVLGAVQYSATLNIYGPPSARQPQNLTVVAMTDVFLRCPVAGYPISSVTWQRGSETLPTHLRHRVFSNGTLLIKQVQGQSDRGQYSCTVTNQQGLSAQGRLFLDVMKPPEIASFDFPHNLQEGMRAHISCSIISGDLPISITWRKDGGPLPQESDVQEQHHQFVSNLLFSNLSAKHSGYYTCIASNAASVANYTAKLVVRVAPTWLIEPQDVSVLYQHPVSLHCQATGFPTPTVTWMKAAGEQSNEYIAIDSGPHLTISANRSILIRAADHIHEGHYTCQANNGIGTGLSKVIYVRVNVPAHFRSRAVNQSGVAGEGVILVCEADGDLPLRISWSATHRPVGLGHPQVRERHSPSGLISELHLDNLIRSDAGSYHCSAANEFGQDEMLVYLVVKETPDAPGRVEVSEAGSRWISISWGAPYAGHSQISHYVVQFKDDEINGLWNNVSVTGSVRTARIGSLRPATGYTLRLLAVNDVGSGPPSEPVQAVTLQEAPSGPPLDVVGQAISSESLIIRWKPPLTTYSNGQIMGYQVFYHDMSANSAEPAVKTVRGRKLEAVVSGLRQYTRYEISVRAFNQIGAGPVSPPLVVSTLEGVPNKPPQDVRCTSLSSQNLRVRWESPPAEHRNGLVEGYKVYYKQVGHHHRTHEPEVKKTTNLETNLHGLSKFTNYSIRVLAYTSSGEGVRSSPIYCTTDEDIPGSPDQIKALTMTSDSILVTWTRPYEPNGNIVKYNVYIQSLQQHGVKEIQKESVFGDRELTYEARRLKEFQRYEFWVTASTVIGEGPPSLKITQSPISKVPARIASFSKHITAGLGQTISIGCQAVGLPSPSKTWRGPTGTIQSYNQHRSQKIIPDGSLTLGPLRSEDAGNYTCQVENVFGKDEVMYGVQVQVPPAAPSLVVVSTTGRSLNLQWKVSDDGGSPIIGFTLTWKIIGGEWLELDIEPDKKSYTLDSIKCGSTYELYLTATNNVGKGKASGVVTASTKGSAPKIPTQEDLFIVNTTSITVYLDAWPTGGCSIDHFTVEYKQMKQSSYTLINGNAHQEELVISDLHPASWYAIRVVAFNDAGSSSHEFFLATRTRSGDLLPMELIPDMSEQQGTLYSHLNIIIPIISGVLCVLAASICVCVVVKRRSYAGYKKGATDYSAKSLAELENQRNTEQGNVGQLYSPSPARKGQDYEICPYATFSLPVPPAGNNTTQPIDYTMQFQTFSQQDCYEGRPSTSGYGKASKEYYARVRSSKSSNHSVSSKPGAQIKDGKQKRTSKSPPDGLSLEVSCISSQQTLPISAVSAHRRKKSPPAHRHQQSSQQSERETNGPTSAGGGYGRPRSCPMRRSDSESSGKSVSPTRQYRGHKSSQPHEFDVESSTESAEASPEVNHRPRRGRRGVPSR